MGQLNNQANNQAQPYRPVNHYDQTGEGFSSFEEGVARGELHPDSQFQQLRDSSIHEQPSGYN